MAIIVVVSSLPAVVRSLVVVVTSAIAVGVIRSCHLRVSLPLRNLDYNQDLKCILHVCFIQTSQM